MNFKELLVPLSLALVTTWALQYYFNARKPTSEQTQEVHSGRHFIAPKSTEVEVHKPLNLEVNFLEGHSSKKTVLTDIQTKNGAYYVFSTEGASLERLEFRHNERSAMGPLTTVFPPPITDKERRCFLVALDEKTPYYFDFVSKTNDEDHFYITYKADFKDGSMYKQFDIFNHEYRIDLTITLEPSGQNSTPLQPRVFFPAPLIAELGKDDWIKGIVNDGDQKIRTYEKSEETINSYWSKPTLFGTEDRYFVHAMVKDPQNFTQRAYFRVFDLENLHSILEGPTVQEKTTWKLTFYFGPKEDTAIKLVDERLTQVLNYGWLAPISRPVSKIMLDILNVINDYCKNYGLAIILLTLLMKLLMLPFTFGSERNMKKRLEFQKRLQHLQDKYKNDKETLAAARADLIRKNGMPGLGGCIPVLMQIPLFIALSWVLANSIELYKAPFLWIKDLSASDPYYILPILVGLTMLFHNPMQSADPKQKISVFAMAIIFAAFTTNLSAGLVLYILTSTFLGVVQSMAARRFAA